MLDELRPLLWHLPQRQENIASIDAQQMAARYAEAGGKLTNIQRNP